MAISKEKKKQVVDEVSNFLENSKLTVYAQYEGLSVKDIQSLRQLSLENSTHIRVVKNRLFKVALAKNDKFKEVERNIFSGQLLYAFNSEDEVAPAKDLVEFARKYSALKPVGGFDISGISYDEVQITNLAKLPSKDDLRAQLTGTVAAPISGFVNVLVGNISGLINVLKAKSQLI